MAIRGFRAAGIAAVVISSSALAGGVAQAQGFPDVPQGHWAAESVTKLAKAGILKGYPADQAKAAGKPAAAAAQAKQGYNGNKPVTRYELAVTLHRFVDYMERADRQKKGRARALPAPQNGAATVRALVAGGYLKKNTPLAREGGKVVTANETADALSQVVTRIQERKTPITPDSERTIEKPSSAPGT